MLEILAAPLVACLLLAGIHCYFGLHVLMRDVVFVDLSLAQLAALGVAVGAVAGAVPHSGESHVWALAFTVLGALLFSLGRLRDRRVSREAVIGIVYAVSAASMFLILSRSAVDREEVEHMLVGRLLFVDWPEIGSIALTYAGVAAVHVAWGRRFFAISRGGEDMTPARVRLWDFVFYTSFGVIVASSVQVAGVLLVFSLLVVPAACASLFWAGVRSRLLAGWAFGLVGCGLGTWLSAALDLPTGASVVATLGALFGASCALSATRRVDPHDAG